MAEKNSVANHINKKIDLAMPMKGLHSKGFPFILMIQDLHEIPVP